MRTTLLTSACLSFSMLSAQGLTGAQQQPAHGYSFTIPDGWVGEVQDGSYALTSEVVAGIILIGPTAYASAEVMRTELAAPTEDGPGTSMRPTEGPTDLGNNTVFVAHAGTLEGAPMKVVAIGTWNPSGKSVTVAGLAPPDTFSKELMAALKLVRTSVRYTSSVAGLADPTSPRPSKAAAAPEGQVDQFWTERLSGNRLTYMDSYSSPAGYPGGMSGGYSITRKIDLCPQGFFTTNGNSDHNFGGDGVSGYGNSSSAGEGTWSAVRGESGKTLLRLRFKDGSVRDYLLDNRDGSTYLNNERWYRTNRERDGVDYAPNCP